GKEVYLDGGIRRGGDAVKAIAMGARACLIGRPYLWGLAVNGEEGAVQVLEILRAEIDSVLGLLGRPTLADLDRTALNLPCHASSAYETLRAHHGRTGFT
ncbi:MAG: alpha-hydroxy-acid oxidizing protein, partial [Thermomicrobiales bacterium]|nr:alpha-hydroxy-acid oxidizing protein [Thermomicrobiales bacterium]